MTLSRRSTGEDSLHDMTGGKERAGRIRGESSLQRERSRGTSLQRENSMSAEAKAG